MITAIVLYGASVVTVASVIGGLVDSDELEIRGRHVAAVIFAPVTIVYYVARVVVHACKKGW